MSRIVTGTLHAYWEQGFEGRIEYTLLPDEGRPAGAPIWLASGQALRVWAPTGELLWEGTVRLVPRRHFLFWRESHDLSAAIWNDHTQAGVPYRRWISWFWHKPPLRAELTLQA